MPHMTLRMQQLTLIDVQQLFTFCSPMARWLTVAQRSHVSGAALHCQEKRRSWVKELLSIRLLYRLQVELLSWKSEKDISGDGALPPAFVCAVSHVANPSTTRATVPAPCRQICVLDRAGRVCSWPMLLLMSRRRAEDGGQGGRGMGASQGQG